MFKKEINFISDLNINKLQILGDRFTTEDIKRSKIHPAIFQYISASIDKEIFSDRKKIENDSIYNYSSDRINNYFSFISKEIKRTQRFDFDYIKLFLQNAIVFNINYLTNPNNTLTKLIFSDSEVKSIEEITIGISHAYYYRYLQKILLTYLDKKKILLMNKAEFSDLLNRVDAISKETHFEETITTAVNSMANFFDANSKISERLPIQAIKLYLDEKELPEFVTRLENKFGNDKSALFLTNDIINELKSVIPEAEIAIKESSKVEDNLIIDDSENENIGQIESENEIYESTSKTEEVIEINNESIISEEIFEIDSDDIEIPNHEILSSDESLEKNMNEILEITENITEIDSDPIESIEVNEEIYTDEENIISIKNSPNETNDVELEENSKKKKVAELLEELIDVNPIYESLLPPLKPFETLDKKSDSVQFIDNLSDETNYQIDFSTIKEEIDTNKIDSIESDHNSHYSNVEPEEVISRNELVKEEYNLEEITTKSDIIESNDFDGEQKLENLIESKNLSLNDDDVKEISEVFTDLTFLEQEEIISPDNFENEFIDSSSELSNQKEYDEPNLNSSSFEHHDNFENFSEMLASKDMTKIIEYVFDYDMEDYYSIIDQISKTADENEAFKLTDGYCKNNHVDLSAKEVDLFKFLISEYFTQVYS